ncbi:hypothetical protein [Pusillimonas minor]|uniref:Uncharacterized protein n=1 Tax=Pusillimonas minor TaxID=2697024 RepID=A0A842HMG7_9BURK|nr:hypothetical protein [Pusillimonas minor]MBC2768922.1 hypothetical protein [Pusillimonas minor]
MPYFRQFNQFHPFTGTVPLVPFFALRDIAERARTLLHGASIEQIIQLAESIEWMINSGLSRAHEDALSEGESPVTRGMHSDAKWLSEFISAYDVQPPTGKAFPNQHHAIAVLALWQVVDALLSIQPDLDVIGHHVKDVSESASVERQLMYAGKYVIDAMEAICVAEKLFEQHNNNRLSVILIPSAEDELKTAVKTRISLQAQAAAIEKHKTNHAARVRAIELYTSRNYSSVEAAAQAIAAQVFMAPRTVAKWIYDERKGRTTSLTAMPA